MINPLPTVMMAAYDMEKYIGEAIEGILFSSFSDFELIIVGLKKHLITYLFQNIIG